ncbi:MAG TPA: hypothetical protein VFE58_02630 [Tepidisphaeraceae bacterium]|jgi:asparagine synthase (glutamine-hydrolysing)|nr:hypothetical protein [Tepidisphaeraceae bacterium]
MLPSPANWSVQIHGYTTLTVSTISQLLEANRAVDLVRHPGSFIISATRASTRETYIITSAYGAINYFYAVQNQQFYHASTVAEILEQSRIPFRWNISALVDLFSLDHLTGNASPHRDVHRTPAGSVLHFVNSSLQTTILSWSDLHPETGPADPDRAADLFAAETARFAGPDPVLSASAGFDSRLLLAALLHAGLRPRLLVAGSPESTDRIVTEQIARHYNLPITPVELTHRDFPSVANTVTRATNGTKTAYHWHTYLYPHLGHLSLSDRLLVGANGEFARTYYLDRGILSRAFDFLPAKPLALQFWKRKILISRVFREGFKHLKPELADALANSHVAEPEKIWSLNPDRSLLRHFDQTYLSERVRHVITNGLTLYSLSAMPITPFLSTGWVSEIDRLPRYWKFGSRWHRHAIARLQPSLLNFLEQGTTGPMRRTPKPFYWRRKKMPTVNLYDRDGLFRDNDFLSLLPAHADALSEIADPDWIRQVVAEHRSTEKETRFIANFLPLAVWRSNLS